MKHTNNSRGEEGVASPQNNNIVEIVRALRETGDEVTILDMKMVVIPAISFDRLEQVMEMLATKPIKQNPSSGESS